MDYDRYQPISMWDPNLYLHARGARCRVWVAELQCGKRGCKDLQGGVGFVWSVNAGCRCRRGVDRIEQG